MTVNCSRASALAFVTLAPHRMSFVCWESAGPLWAGRCRRENGLAVLPPGKSGGLFLLVPLAPQALRHLVEQGTLGGRQALEPFQRDLVQHAVELVHSLLTRACDGRCDHAWHWPWLLCRHRLALGDDLVHVVPLRST